MADRLTVANYPENVLPRLLALLVTAGLSTGAAGAANAVTDLQKRIDSGTEELEFDARWGYLPSLLKSLDIPTSSQLLVFSKTSAQFRLISPRRPRAIYFNDDVYVGWVQRAPVLEISVVDPAEGAKFFTLHQIEEVRPQFIADTGTCLQCHESGRTMNLPGHLTRSVFPDPDGLPYFGQGTINVDHTTPFRERWGGWFVTGNLRTPHRGNAVGEESEVEAFEIGRLHRDPSDFFVPAEYLTSHSDPAAHLILAHQTQGHNAIAKAGQEAITALKYKRQMTRIFGEPSDELLASVKRRIEGPSERLVTQMLLLNEAPLPEPVKSASGFVEDFESRPGKLRNLDLRTRLFRYPCSFLLESEAFRGLPTQVKAYVEQRFREYFAESQSGAYSQAGAAGCLCAVANAML